MAAPNAPVIAIAGWDYVNSQIVLSWQAVLGASWYTVFRANFGSSGQLTLTQVGGTTTSTTVTVPFNPQASGRYNLFAVKAGNADGQSGYSNIIQAWIDDLSIYTPPPQPILVLGAVAAAPSIVIGIQNPLSEAEAVTFECSYDGLNYWAPIPPFTMAPGGIFSSASAPGAAYTDTNAVRWGDLRWYRLAVTVNGIPSYQMPQVVQVPTMVAGGPQTPTNVRVVSIINGALVLGWDAPSAWPGNGNVTGVRVFRVDTAYGGYLKQYENYGLSATGNTAALPPQPAGVQSYKVQFANAYACGPFATIVVTI